MNLVNKLSTLIVLSFLIVSCSSTTGNRDIASFTDNESISTFELEKLVAYKVKYPKAKLHSKGPLSNGRRASITYLSSKRAYFTLKENEEILVDLKCTSSRYDMFSRSKRSLTLRTIMLPKVMLKKGSLDFMEVVTGTFRKDLKDEKECENLSLIHI